MGRRYNNEMVFWAGAILLAGMLTGGEAQAMTIKEPDAVEYRLQSLQNSLLNVKDIWRCLGAEYQYIDGLEEIGVHVLERGSEEKKNEEEISLFARETDIRGSRVYANVMNFVNVREQPSTASKVLGKLYEGCIATVIEDAGDWVFVKSGNVTGYVIKEYLLFGDEAEAAIAKKYAPKIKVTANALNMRVGAGTETEILHTFSKGDTADLLEKGTEWIKIRLSVGNEKKTGYVFAKYVTVTGEPATGETLAEEAARIEAEKKAAAEAAKKAEEAKKAAAEQAKRSTAEQVADYAKTAVGTAYKKYGYTLPRVSRDMAASKSLLSVTPNTSYLKKGDLVFYASGGRVDHVAMYIGDGKVVHASDYNTGVIISRYNYRTPHSAKRVIY